MGSTRHLLPGDARLPRRRARRRRSNGGGGVSDHAGDGAEIHGTVGAWDSRVGRIRWGAPATGDRRGGGDPRWGLHRPQPPVVSPIRDRGEPRCRRLGGSEATCRCSGCLHTPRTAAVGGLFHSPGQIGCRQPPVVSPIRIEASLAGAWADGGGASKARTSAGSSTRCASRQERSAFLCRSRTSTAAWPVTSKGRGASVFGHRHSDGGSARIRLATIAGLSSWTY